MKTEHLARLPIDQAIQALKDESTPKHKVAIKSEDKCEEKAGKDITDDWGDSCEGYQCWREKGHEGRHMAGDGANGYIYWG